MLDPLIPLLGFFALLAFFGAGLPIFVAFLLLDLAAILYFFGVNGLPMAVNSIFATATSGSLSSVPLFILMGEILFRSGTVDVMWRALDRLMGRFRGRTYVLTILLSALFGAMSGSAVAVVAMMGRALVPSMRTSGCDERLSAGVVMAGANLAPIIPPSIVAIIIGSMAKVSIAGLLVAGIGPGLLIAAMLVVYVLVRLRIDPRLVPQDAAAPAQQGSIVQALLALAPFTVIVFSVLGLILLGVATPSESAAAGVAASLLVAAVGRRLTLANLFEAIGSSAITASLLLVIMVSSNLFSQLLAFTGVASGLVAWMEQLDLGYWGTFAVLMGVPLVLCMFVDQIALLFILIPLYQPIVDLMGYEPIWFWMLFLVNLAIGSITPPFGYTLFAYRSAVPEMTLERIFAAIWPFVGIYLLGIGLMTAMPQIVTWLPSIANR